MYKLIDAHNVDWSAIINSLSNGCYMKTKGICDWDDLWFEEIS